MSIALSRRQWLQTSAALAAGLATGTSFASTKAWPTAQPVRIIVPFPAGGVNDVVARRLALASVAAVCHRGQQARRGRQHGHGPVGPLAS
ncbi:MAG: twin-arginine translocation signal domain-containing protein [Comamonas sp.]